MVFEQVYNNYAREANLADDAIDAMFLKESLHGVKKNAGLGAGAQPPPFARTTSLSHVLKGAIWVLFLLAGWYLTWRCTA